MKTKVTFNVLYNDGKKGNKIVVIEHPEFKSYNFEFKGYVLTKSFESQVDEYVENEFDKVTFMEDYNIYLIFDWKIKTKIPKNKLTEKEKLGILVRACYKDQKLIDDFEATYNKLYKDIKNYKFDKQFSIVSSALFANYTAASTAYKNIAEILRGNAPKRLN